MDKTGKSKDKNGRTVFRNLFERIKPDEKEKIKEKIDKKEIKSYIIEEVSKNIQGSKNNGN